MAVLFSACCPCFRKMLNEMRQEVNKLTAENEKLKEQNAELEKSVVKLQDVEKKLADLAVLQGQSVDVLVKQVEEWRTISQEMEENLKSRIIQNVLSVIFTADQDGDFIIDAEEVEGLKARLTTLEGVDFSQENFKKALVKAGHDPTKVDIEKGGYSIQSVMEVLRNLMDQNVPDEDNIFTIQPNME